MKNYRLIRNIWFFTGCVWIITLTINIIANGWLILIALNTAAMILSFVTAYIYNRKIKKQQEA